MQGTKKVKIRKTVRLTPAERKALNAFAKKYGTQEETAQAIGLDIGTYARIKELGRGNSINISLVIKAIA